MIFETHFMKERLVIIIVAIIAGLFITSAGFFIYQSTKKIEDTPAAKDVSISPTGSQQSETIYVRLTDPKDEALTNKRSISIKGTTNPGNLIVISTNLEDVQVKPTTEGSFSVTIDIDAGANTIITRAISPTGISAQDVRTITYSTEDF